MLLDQIVWMVASEAGMLSAVKLVGYCEVNMKKKLWLDS